MSPQFGSTIQELNAVERLLSKERFLTYVTHAGGDREKAFRLYVHNLRLSSSLFETIGGLEIAFRNSVHLTLTQAFRSDNWFDNVPFTWLPHERGAIQKAKELIRSRKKQVLPGRIIAELTFGFWCGITGRAYRDLLWIPHLHKAFPFKRLGHKEAHNRLNEIRELRNRIAHHECVLHLDPARKYSNIVETVNWICPTTGSWIETNSSFPSICQSPPA